MTLIIKSEHEKRLVEKIISDRNKAGSKTPKEKLNSVKKASPDHPIYKRGIIIGGHHPGNLLKKTSK